MTLREAVQAELTFEPQPTRDVIKRALRGRRRRMGKTPESSAQAAITALVADGIACRPGRGVVALEPISLTAPPFLPAQPEEVTIAQHIDAAIAGLEHRQAEIKDRLRDPVALGVRDLAIAITHLETARMFSNRGIAKMSGRYSQVDMERMG